MFLGEEKKDIDLSQADIFIKSKMWAERPKNPARPITGRPGILEYICISYIRLLRNYRRKK